MRNGFIFYKSFAEAYRELPNPKEKIKLIDAIVDYALDDKDAELTGITKAIFSLIKPQIDANNKKYENGKKGGRPKSLDDRIEEARNTMKKTKA